MRKNIGTKALEQAFVTLTGEEKEREGKRIQRVFREINIAELKEKLAAIEHDRWSSWMFYFFENCEYDKDGNSVIPREYVTNLLILMNTQYEHLSEEQKQNDRLEVEKYWPLIEEFIR